jgi:hypothetical protein
VRQKPSSAAHFAAHIDREGGGSGEIMSAPFIVSIPHRLGKDEAVRRLKAGLGNASSNYRHLFAVEEEIWTGEHLQFRVSALGQVASGTIDVGEEYVTLQVFLPWLLAKIASAIQPLVRKEGTLLLEKKTPPAGSST